MKHSVIRLTLTSWHGVWLSGLLFSSFVTGAWGQVLFEQPFGPGSNVGFASHRPWNFFSPGFRAADNFQLTADAVIGTVEWWGNYSLTSQLSEAFEFTVYTDDNGLPGSAVQTTTASSFSRTGAGGIWEFYRSDLVAPFYVSAGQKYWLSIYNNGFSVRWDWAGADIHGDGRASLPPDSTIWESRVRDAAFRLIGIPEPSAWLLALLSCAAFLSQRYRR